MGTGQMLLAAGAMMLLATLSISINGTLVDNDEIIRENAFALGVLGLGQSLIEEALRLSFDETLIGTPPAQMPQGFTPADSGLTGMGPDGAETYPNGFDDIDDFNGFDQVMTLGDNAIPFRVRVCVGYIRPASGPPQTRPPRPATAPATTAALPDRASPCDR